MIGSQWLVPRKRQLIGFAIILLLGLLPALVGGTNPTWQTVAPGMELGYVTVREPSAAGDSRIAVLRMDPKLWELAAIGVSQTGEFAGHTVRDWCERHKLVAAINAGMFEADQKTHLGYMRFRDHVYTRHANKYQSIAAFDLRDGKDLPRFHIFDLDAPGVTMQSIQQDYDSAVQNLRLVKRQGSNQWGHSLHQRLQQFRCLHCCSDYYRVERTSSRAGLTPAVDHHPFTAHAVRTNRDLRIVRLFRQ